MADNSVPAFKHLSGQILSEIADALEEVIRFTATSLTYDIIACGVAISNKTLNVV